MGNGTLKSVVKRLHHTRLDQTKLKPATTQNILMVAKQVVASAVDKEGNALFPRKWKRKFIDAPRVEPDEQNTPCFTTDEVSQIVKRATGRTQMLCILLAASGLRIGEALGLERERFNGAGVHVVQTIWGNRGMVQKPKTKAGEREADLQPDVAALLQSFIGNRKACFVFQTSSGNLKMWMGHKANGKSKKDFALQAGHSAEHGSGFRASENSHSKTGKNLPTGRRRPIRGRGNARKHWVKQDDPNRCNLRDFAQVNRSALNPRSIRTGIELNLGGHGN